eukprot:CAMPEP_0113685834 /NCGR_PEP_ID=MMETSP0038_2-20120614/14917_1 /TAXON_ID=2898 /ORGANISM="Cryptomonas paramecium" /LENGTH=120 /DNA_ID=CAMNT_0000606015 /DNA_START=21 /DNA_END=384 /DNA_ORIENTATION=+ /assembly_acc=CAM_ASM_000170
MKPLPSPAPKMRCAAGRREDGEKGWEQPAAAGEGAELGMVVLVVGGLVVVVVSATAAGKARGCVQFEDEDVKATVVLPLQEDDLSIWKARHGEELYADPPRHALEHLPVVAAARPHDDSL